MDPCIMRQDSLFRGMDLTFAVDFAIPFTEGRGFQSLVALLAAETGNLMPRLEQYEDEYVMIASDREWDKW